ncbi:hypothetical protein Slin14017_G104150 [Septoria linicola]|nr:hypothetical protein Slin14017_G104150 [Septoria linicola]
MATSTTRQTPSFWSLPPELRIIVYELLLHDADIETGSVPQRLDGVCKLMRRETRDLYRNKRIRTSALANFWTPFYPWVRQRRAFLQTHTPLNPVQLWSMTVPLVRNARYCALHLEAWRPVDVTLADRWHNDVPHHELVLKGEFHASSGHQRFLIARLPQGPIILNFHSRDLLIRLYISYVAAFDEAHAWLTRIAANAPHPQLPALVFRSIRFHRESYDGAVQELLEKQRQDWDQYRNQMALSLQLNALGYQGWPHRGY